jgi:hypothetical protein
MQSQVKKIDELQNIMPTVSIIDACLRQPEILLAHTQSTRSIESFTHNSNNDLPRINLVQSHFVKPRS